jgi:hypothetical protein
VVDAWLDEAGVEELGDAGDEVGVAGVDGKTSLDVPASL